MHLLDIHQLSIAFESYDFRMRKRTMPVIRELSLSVQAGEILAIVGASGSGKSLLAHSILGLLPEHAAISGKLTFDGQPLTDKRMRQLRGNQIALIPQSVQYLNPLMRVGQQVEEAVRIGNPKLERQKVFERFRLPQAAAAMYPYQLSGGMARRVLVCIAAVSGAKLIIADEPTPGLDEQVAQDTLLVFQQMADQGTAILFITHDSTAAAQIADRVAVLHSGELMEIAPASSFTGEGAALVHPYTRALWQALPQNQFIHVKGWQS
ncbi:ABC transporter ATP-binding protein [Paenibacillus sp. FSL W7-1287]|uniref:ABC transporter ATP-binding protein n=1 Tax=Paenibacillus sp. FSL W7-1287 TaxID=2954538 RepID=UPI0030F7C7AF